MANCKIENCDRKIYAKQLCNMHYLRVWKTGNPGKATSVYRSRIRHGLDGHPLQSRWEGMMARCYNQNSTSYKNYGGRGITVCERWWNFANYVIDIGDIPEGQTLDRIDNDGDYEPSNVKWSTRSVQQRNRRVKSPTGHKNIYFRGNKYVVIVTNSKSKSVNLGTFTDINKAIEARKLWEEKS